MIETVIFLKNINISNRYFHMIHENIWHIVIASIITHLYCNTSSNYANKTSIFFYVKKRFLSIVCFSCSYQSVWVCLGFEQEIIESVKINSKSNKEIVLWFYVNVVLKSSFYFVPFVKTKFKKERFICDMKAKTFPQSLFYSPSDANL